VSAGHMLGPEKTKRGEEDRKETLKVTNVGNLGAGNRCSGALRQTHRAVEQVGRIIGIGVDVGAGTHDY